jgi:2-oxoglutarate dehydrogenase E1 component
MMRRPLVVISPKSLLRNPQAVSSIHELTDGFFQYVIDDCLEDQEKVEKVIMCSGKVFYDLSSKREELGIENAALIRIEQLYPFPYDTLEKILKTYKNAVKFVWCQEEPTNQGAWYNHRHRLQAVLDRMNIKNEIALVSREASSAPAVGLNKLHNQQQEALVKEALLF